MRSREGRGLFLAPGLGALASRRGQANGGEGGTLSPPANQGLQERLRCAWEPNLEKACQKGSKFMGIAGSPSLNDTIGMIDTEPVIQERVPQLTNGARGH